MYHIKEPKGVILNCKFWTALSTCSHIFFQTVTPTRKYLCKLIQATSLTSVHHSRLDCRQFSVDKRRGDSFATTAPPRENDDDIRMHHADNGAVLCSPELRLAMQKSQNLKHKFMLIHRIFLFFSLGRRLGFV